MQNYGLLVFVKKLSCLIGYHNMKKYIENIKSFFRKKKRYVELDADTPPPENWKFTYRVNNDGKLDIGEDGKPIVRKFVGYSDNESPKVIIWFLRNQYNLSYEFQGYLWYIECNNDITKLRHPFQYLFKITLDDPNADQSPIRAEATYKTHL